MPANFTLTFAQSEPKSRPSRRAGPLLCRTDSGSAASYAPSETSKESATISRRYGDLTAIAHRTEFPCNLRINP